MKTLTAEKFYKLWKSNSLADQSTWQDRTGELPYEMSLADLRAAFGSWLIQQDMHRLQIIGSYNALCDFIAASETKSGLQSTMDIKDYADLSEDLKDTFLYYAY